MRGRLVILLASAAAVLATPAAHAAVSLQRIDTFAEPSFVTSLPDDPNRLLVTELGGWIGLEDGGSESTFLDLTGLVSSGGDHGLYSLALAPDYEASGHFYVFYTALDGHLQIDEYRASGDSASLSTRRPVLSIAHPTSAFHNGGQLQFGPDGYLYASTGDGGTGGANSEDLHSLLGKILRIDPTPSGGAAYSIPPDNPFVGVNGADEIWSYGLRNPWRFSFDRLTGDMAIGDVGEANWEEVDYEPAPDGGRGADFGWNRCEGRHAFPALTPPAACAAAGTTPPAHEYPHGSDSCSITGGYVVRDPSLGDLYGRYLYADLCSSRISSVHLGLPSATGTRAEPFSTPQPISFGEDSCGRVYVTSITDGGVYRLVGDTPAACSSPTPPVEPEPPAPDPPAPDPEPPAPEPAPTGSCAGLVTTRAPLNSGGRLVGTKDADVLLGSDDDDTIIGRGGDDVICGGDGNDRLQGGGGSDQIRGGAGADDLHGGRGADTCRGGWDPDLLSSC